MINLLSGVDSSAAALNAERIRMEVVSQNIANVNTTRGPDGRPYTREQVVFESVLRNRLQPGTGSSAASVQVARIEPDPRPPRLIYNPTHPHADKATGMLAVPRINVHEEMVDMLTASRAFEANLAVIKTARHLAMQTITIGRR
jgi:flagellar basal-body rod protein FlgC